MPEVVYLLDTNAAIALLNSDSSIDAQLQAAELFIANISVGELYYGAERSSRVAENLRRVDEFVSRRVILFGDLETARWYGHIYQQLRAKGRPIPQNDVWIAAIARQYHLILLTKDAHFKEVDDLLLESW